MDLILNKLFPESANNDFQGYKIALWGFIAFTLLMTWRSIIHMLFEQYGFHEIANFSMIAGDPDPMILIYRFFSLWGFAQLIFCLVCEELRDVVVVEAVPDPVPGVLDHVVGDLETVLLQRHQVAAIVVVVVPAAPHLGVGLAVLAPILGAVVDESTDCGVNDEVLVPQGVDQVPLQQLLVLLVLRRHE